MSIHGRTTSPNADAAERIADLTFQLLIHCQIKESTMAEEFGMSSSELRALRLFHGIQHLPQKEIVDRLGLSGSRLTRIIDGFQERGLATRAEDPGDRRGSIVYLTPTGRTLVAAIDRRSVAIHRELLSTVPEADRPGLVISLETMLCSLQRWVGRRPLAESARKPLIEGHIP